VVERGTGKTFHWTGEAGKTGTTNNNVDLLLAIFRQLVSGVWLSNNSPHQAVALRLPDYG